MGKLTRDIKRFSFDIEMKMPKQNRNNKQTDI